MNILKFIKPYYPMKNYDLSQDQYLYIMHFRYSIKEKNFYHFRIYFSS